MQKLISSNITEMDVILGIYGKLQQTINKAIKTLNPKVIFITASCGSGTTALDIQNVIDSIQDNYSIPLITVTCELYNSKTWGSGFNSKKAGGFNKLIRTIHKEEKFYNVINFSGNDDIKEMPVKKKQINLWTSPPYLDPFWSGNIETLKNMLEQIGFSVNVLFGLSSSVNCWSEIPSAEFNILISAWTGLKIMELLKKHFGTPYFHYPIFLIGAHECSEFLREVANFCELDMNLVNQFIEKKEAMFYYYMERLTRYDSAFPQRFFTIGESTYVSEITRFLVNELGMKED